MKTKLSLIFLMLILNLDVVMSQTIKQYQDIASDIRKKANVAFKGTFQQTIGSCQTYTNDKRRRPLIYSFIIDKDFIGNITLKSIEVKPFWFNKDSSITKLPNERLITGAEYYVLLNLNKEKLKRIQENKENSYGDSLTHEDIVAIIKL